MRVPTIFFSALCLKLKMRGPKIWRVAGDKDAHCTRTHFGCTAAYEALWPEIGTGPDPDELRQVVDH
jgi:hypothetical protein